MEPPDPSHLGVAVTVADVALMGHGAWIGMENLMVFNPLVMTNIAVENQHV